LSLFYYLNPKTTDNRESLVSSLRKTVIIYTATIIEALLLWKLKKVYKSNQVELDDEWEYKDPHKIHCFANSTEEIIWCRRKKVKKKISRLDFLRIIRLCTKHFLSDKKLIHDIDKIRKLRNKLHIGGLIEIDRKYQPEDLEFCFSVLKRVKKLVAKT